MARISLLHFFFPLGKLPPPSSPPSSPSSPSKDSSSGEIVMPGISSISALAARLKEDVQDGVIISTHGVALDEWEQKLISAVVHNEKTYV